MNKVKPIVYVVDDHPSIRKCLDSLLSLAGYEVKTFSSPEEFLKNHGNAQEGCLVLDVLMPGLSGLQLQSLLTKHGFCLPIIFITGSADVPMSVKALKLGAVDFLQKPFDPNTLMETVERALIKNRLELAMFKETALARSKLELLSAREKDVLHLVVKGLLNKQIAFTLGISEKTVKTHRGRAMKKTGVRSVVELIGVVEKARLR